MIELVLHFIWANMKMDIYCVLRFLYFDYLEVENEKYYYYTHQLNHSSWIVKLSSIQQCQQKTVSKKT